MNEQEIIKEVKDKIEPLYTKVEITCNKLLNRPKINIIKTGPVKDKTNINLTIKDINSKKLNDIILKRAGTQITIQIYGEQYKSHERRKISEIIEVKSKSKNIEKWKIWDWSLPQAELARIHGKSRERLRQISHILKRNK